VGVERTFPVHSPSIAKLEVLTRGRVRRAKLSYLRDLRGKKARIKERRIDDAKLAALEAVVAQPAEDADDRDPDEDEAGSETSSEAEAIPGAEPHADAEGSAQAGAAEADETAGEQAEG
jgi:hypothetical protein